MTETKKESNIIKKAPDVAIGNVTVPAAVAARMAEQAEDNMEHVDTPFFRLSIKGVRFKVEGELIGKDKTGLEFDAEILRECKVNMYYKNAYNKGDEGEVPLCYSVGGKIPDPEGEKLQHTECASCPQNQWGTAIDRETGEPTKGKACGNTRRLVLRIEGVNLPVLLSLPPTSVKQLNSHLKRLTAIGVPVAYAWTRFTFDTTAEYPLVLMDLVRPMETVEELDEADDWRGRPSVMAALNSFATAESDSAPTNHTDEIEPDDVI